MILFWKRKKYFFIGLFVSASLFAQSNEGGVIDTLDASIKIGYRSVAKEAGRYELPSIKIRRIVGPTGEADVIKFIQTLPGVAMGSEGSATVYARGGNIGGNLVTLDGEPIYRPTHLLGFTMAFDPSIIGETEFYIGGFDFEEGNFTSSHIKMTSRPADFRKVDGSVSLSNFLAGANVSAPIVKDKLTLTLSARTSTLPLEYLAVKKWINASQSVFNDLTFGVYDVYGKLHYRINNQNELSFSAFRSFDKFGFSRPSDTNLLGWDNTIAWLNYKCVLSDKMELRVKGGYNYNTGDQMQQVELKEAHNRLEIQNYMKEANASAQMVMSLNENMRLKYGISTKFAWFKQGTARIYIDRFTGAREVSELPSSWTRTEMASANGQFEWSQDKFSVRGSVRMNVYHNSDEHRIKDWYFVPEASVMGKYGITGNLGIEATIDYVSQFYHTLEGVPMGWSVDMLVPAGSVAAPESALQGYLGAFSDIGILHFSLGAYYKKMYNLIYYADATSFFSSSLPGWKNNIETGTGNSYGMEFLCENTGDRLNYKLAYTLSKTDRFFENVNRSMPFPAKFDRRHILNAMASYAFIDKEDMRLEFITNFTYQSGQWETIQDGYIPGWGIIDQTVNKLPMISSVNNYRMPAYIRWDNTVQMELPRRSVKHVIGVGVYNTLNRHNPSMVFYNQSLGTWQTISLIPIMPTLSYKLEF